VGFHAAPHMTIPNATPPPGWHVVIIDDSPEDRAEIRRLLFRGAERRYTFTETETGAAGVKAVFTGPALPDCVVLDFNLPDMDALEVLAQLAGADGLPICPVVVLTGGVWQEMGRTVLRAGAQDYIAKDGLIPVALTRTMENAIERLAMARELFVRNAALLNSEQKLSEADRRKDEFIATLAHELRNPLAPIATGIQVLRLGGNRASLDILDVMDRHLNQMTHLIDDLMEISRITSGKMLLKPQRMSVSALMEDAAEAAMPFITAARHNITVQLPSQPMWIDVDPTRIVQVIGNLLNNASKYSPNGSEITLSAHHDDAHAVIKVADTGMGIPEEMLTQVFDMFAQVSNTQQRAQDGLGIGLALVKQLVEMHGGTVLAESAGIGHGSTFIIRLPVMEAPPEFSTAGLAQPSSASADRRILVVDDNVDGAMMLSMMLSLSGHVIHTVYSGEEAIAAATAFQPEVVFLDLGLPGMSGFDVARHFRATPGLQDTVIIALTGWGGAEDRRRSKEAGFDLHLTKPARLADIENVHAQYVLLSIERRSVNAEQARVLLAQSPVVA
jgi:signal transduction histidine kinase